MHQDQNSARLGPQRHLLQMVLQSKLGEAGAHSDVSPSSAAGSRPSRTASPALQADDIQGSQGVYADVQGMGVLLGGTPTSQLARGMDAEAFAGGLEDRKHLPDRSHWGMIGANSAVGGGQSLSGDSLVAWAHPSPLEGSPAGLLSEQASYDDQVRDTEVEAPMANLHLQQSEGLVGSWPGAARHASATTDAALPFFHGRPIRTGSTLSTMSAGAVPRTGSFNGGHPGSARASMGHDTPVGFPADQLCFAACNSAPITPRSPGFGFPDDDAAGVVLPGVGGGGGGMRPAYESRHGPSKLRVSSSDAAQGAQALHLPAASAALAAAAGGAGLHGMGLDAFGGAAPCPLGIAGADQMASNLMALQQQQLQMAAQQHGGMMPGAGVPPAAMAQAAALMASMGADPAALQQAGGPAMHGFGCMPGAMMPDAAGGAAGMGQMQMLMYYAQLGMMAQMTGGGGGAGAAGVHTAAAVPALPPGGAMMFPMMSPQQVAAACAAAQQQWQSGMPATAIANIAAAAAVAATAATNPDGEPGSGGGRNPSRPRGSMLDKCERRLRLDKGGRGSSGRLDAEGCGSPSVGGRMDPLLEEFKSNRTRRWEMREILGHMLEFSLDQLGSRFIQQKLDTLAPEELEAAFAEVAPKGLMLMNDVFGNYVIQKFLEIDVEAHRQELAAQMKGQVLQLSLQLYSCRVIQKALEVLPLEQKISMVGELDGYLMRCVRDQNGNHVIQKVIECVPTEHITSLLDSFSGSLVSLSQHPFGCRVMQRILEHCTDRARYNAFMVEILKATVQLAQDQYGNYVIQHVVEQGKGEERDAVYERLFPHIVVLSQNKFASNVVEKMLLHCSPVQRGAIVEEFLRQPSRRSSSDGLVFCSGGGAAGAAAGAAEPAEPSALEQMMQDQYGNYVVQKTLEVCDEGQRERLLARVRCYYETLKVSQFGKHIVNRLEKLLSAGMRIQVNSITTSAVAAPAAAVQQAAPAAAAAEPPAAAGGQQS